MTFGIMKIYKVGNHMRDKVSHLQQPTAFLRAESLSCFSSPAFLPQVKLERIVFRSGQKTAPNLKTRFCHVPHIHTLTETYASVAAACLPMEI